MRGAGLSVILVSVALAGCSLMDRVKPGAVAVVNTCPAPKPYPKAFQAQVAREMRAHGNEVPGMATMIGDYSALRDALRDCQRGA